MSVEFRSDDPTYPGDKEIADGVEIEDVIILVEDMLPPKYDTTPFNPSPNPQTKKFEMRACLWLLNDESGSDLGIFPQIWDNDYDDPPDIILEFSYIQSKGGLRISMPHEGKHYPGVLFPVGTFPVTDPGYTIG